MSGRRVGRSLHSGGGKERVKNQGAIATAADEKEQDTKQYKWETSDQADEKEEDTKAAAADATALFSLPGTRVAEATEHAEAGGNITKARSDSFLFNSVQ